MFSCPGALEGTTVCGSGLKRLRRRGNSLKSHPTDWWSLGTNSGPLVTRRVTYSLHHAESSVTLFIFVGLVWRFVILVLVGYTWQNILEDAFIISLGVPFTRQYSLEILLVIVFFKHAPSSLGQRSKLRCFVRGSPKLTRLFFKLILRGEQIQITLKAGHHWPTSEMPIN